MLFAGLSGRIYSNLSRLFRWHPVGKPVRINIADAQDSTMVGKVLYGVITQVAQVKASVDASLLDECPVIKLHSAANYNGHRLDAVLAVPRYVGYGLHSLPFTGTAFYLITISHSDVPAIFRMQDVIAISWVSISRFKRGVR